MLYSAPHSLTIIFQYVSCLRLWQDSRAPMKRPASEMQEVNKDTQSATKMARFGNLDAQHLKLLDALPKSALPDRPPAGQHQYTLYMGMSVKVIVKLSAKVFVLCHVDNGRSRSFPFHEGDVSCVWDDVWTLATSWKHWPDLHCPPRAARQAAADPPLPASGSADQQLESAAAGPAPVSADDSETERFDGDCENNDSSDTSSSHWGDGGLHSAADRPFLRRAWPLRHGCESDDGSSTLDSESSDTSSQHSALV